MRRLLYILSLLLSITFSFAQTIVDQGVKKVTVDYNISDIKYTATPPPGKITIIGDAGGGSGNGGGSQQDLPGGKDYQIKDKDGNIWNVDENGNVTKGGKVAEGGASNSTNTDGVTGSGNNATVNQYTAKGIKIEWKENAGGQFAYDTAEKTKLPADKYPSVKDINGTTVSVPYKATVNKQTELFNAKVSITDPALKDAKIEFKTLSIGKAIPAKELNKTDTERTYQLELVGAFDYAEEEVIAVVVPKDSTAKQQVISSFRLVHLSPKDINVALVPTDAESKKELSNIETQTNAIYKKVGVKINFNRDDVFDIAPYLNGNTVIPTEKNTALSTYSSVQQAINKGYGNKNNDRYILFVTDRNSDKAGQLGYMRLNGQFGYVFKEGLNLNKTGAHELGHGIFKLEHPFENLGIGEKTTPLLMDYSTGEELSHLDWKQINDPAFKLYAFQSQSSGEMYDRLFKDANGKYFNSGKNISVAVCLNKDEVQQANLLPSGSVYAFHLVDSGKMYYAQKENDKYIYKTKSGETIDLTYVAITNANQKNAFTIYYPSAYKVTAKDYFGKNAEIIGACSGGKFSSQQEEDEAYAFWQFLKNCYDSYKLQKEGYVPRCLWDHNLYIPNGPFGYYINDPAFSSGIVDGLIETADGVLDIVKFLDCYNPTSFRAWTDECVDTRDKTYNALKQMYLVISDKDKLNEAYDAVKGKLGEYIDETTAVDNQARYNHGKIVFNVASLFIGVGEAKALLNGEKTLALVLKEGLSAYATIPETILKLTQKAGREGIAYIALKTGNKGAYLGYKLANTEIKLADVTAQQVFANIEWATKNGVVLEKIENVSFVDKAGTQKTGVLEIVKQEDGKLGVRVVDEIRIFKNIPYDDFIKTFTATEEQYKKAYQLWGEEKWDELYQYFKTNNLNDDWPPFEGFVKITKTETGNELAGKVFDRFQGPGGISGKFASPVYGTQGIDDLYFTYDSRALKYNIGENTNYVKFKFKDNLPSDLKFDYGDVQPWFGKQGLGDQVKSSADFKELKNYIEILEQFEFKNKKWVKIK